jgi:hypothetical protein
VGEGLPIQENHQPRDNTIMSIGLLYIFNISQIWPGSSGSGSRTGMSGFSGGLSGSRMGGGAGSEGARRSYREMIMTVR